MKKRQSAREAKKIVSTPVPHRIENPSDLWEHYNVIDAESYSSTEEISRLRIRVQNNRQRLDFVKMLVRAGVLKGDRLMLPAHQ